MSLQTLTRRLERLEKRHLTDTDIPCVNTNTSITDDSKDWSKFEYEDFDADSQNERHCRKARKFRELNPSRRLVLRCFCDMCIYKQNCDYKENFRIKYDHGTSVK